MPETSTPPAHRPFEPPGPTAVDRSGAFALDPQAVEQLRQLDPGGANRLILRVVEAYRGSAEKLVPQLHDAMARGDLAGVRRVAHTLKSSSANVGASQLAQLCASVETMVRTGETAGLDEAVHAMCAEVDRAVAALGQLQEVRA